MLNVYKRYKLDQLLMQIRTPGRYKDMDGYNVLTNALPYENFRRDLVELTLLKAFEEKKRIQAIHSLNDALGFSDFLPDSDALKDSISDSIEILNSRDEFSPVLGSEYQGLSHGLNPYSDWSLSQLEAEPRHWCLVLGIDWYPISELGDGTDWFEYLEDPFANKPGEEDPFWNNTWAWILGRSKLSETSWDTITANDASEFIKSSGIAFLFHNRLPYLRPPGIGKGNSEWRDNELKKKAITRDCIADLALIRMILGERLTVICTGKESATVLKAAGYSHEKIHRWGAHPSRKFFPHTVPMKFADLRVMHRMNEDGNW